MRRFVSRFDRNRSYRLVFVLALLVSATLGARADDSADWRTPAEITDYRSTPSHEQTLQYLRRVAARLPEMSIASFGRSASGRDMPLVVVATDGIDTPAEAIASGRAIVLIQSGIHGGEIDGKDATLALLRDLALGQHREILDGTVLLFVPIYNVDGHERVSPWNRPNQDGPVEGMGFRTTADGHDLNRDSLKLETPEARALIGLVQRWRPHLLVDNHVTDGVDLDWTLTWTVPEPPQVSAGVGSWVDEHLARAAAATEAAGHRVGPYVSLRDPLDPLKGFSSWIGEARYATGYVTLMNRPSVLVENHSYKPYRARVLANQAFLLALLNEVAQDGPRLVRAVAEAEARTVALGRPGAPPSAVVVRWREAPPTETAKLPIYDWTVERATTTGEPYLRYDRGRIREIEVPWIRRAKDDWTLRRPRGYYVLPGWPAIENRLRGHRLQVSRLTASSDADVEVARLADPRPTRGGRSYQGLSPIEVAVERAVERRHLPAGTLWVPADQPDFAIAVQLFEPDSPDSLLAWGILSLVLEQKEYIDDGVLEAQAAQLLKQPAQAAAWAAALADPKFAADARARFDWWYRRTPHWDETIGLLPIFRAHAPPTVPIEPWGPD